MASPLNQEALLSVRKLIENTLSARSNIEFKLVNEEYMRLCSDEPLFPLYLLELFAHPDIYGFNVSAIVGSHLTHFRFHPGLRDDTAAITWLRNTALGLLPVAHTLPNPEKILPDMLTWLAQRALGGVWPQLIEALVGILSVAVGAAAGTPPNPVAALVACATLRALCSTEFTSIVRNYDAPVGGVLRAALGEGAAIDLIAHAAAGLGELVRAFPPSLSGDVAGLVNALFSAGARAIAAGSADSAAAVLECFRDLVELRPAAVAPRAGEVLNLAVSIVTQTAGGAIPPNLGVAALRLSASLFTGSFDDTVTEALTGYLENEGGASFRTLLANAASIAPEDAAAFALDDENSAATVASEFSGSLIMADPNAFSYPLADGVRGAALIALSDVALRAPRWAVGVLAAVRPAADAAAAGAADMAACLALEVALAGAGAAATTAGAVDALGAGVTASAAANEAAAILRICAAVLGAPTLPVVLRVTAATAAGYLVPDRPEAAPDAAAAINAAINALLTAVGGASRAVARAALGSLTALIEAGRLPAAAAPAAASAAAGVLVSGCDGSVLVAACALIVAVAEAAAADGGPAAVAVLAPPVFGRIAGLSDPSDPRVYPLFAAAAAVVVGMVGGNEAVPRHSLPDAAAADGLLGLGEGASAAAASVALATCEVFGADVAASPEDLTGWRVAPDTAEAAVNLLGALLTLAAAAPHGTAVAGAEPGRVASVLTGLCSLSSQFVTGQSIQSACFAAIGELAAARPHAIAPVAGALLGAVLDYCCYPSEGLWNAAWLVGELARRPSTLAADAATAAATLGEVLARLGPMLYDIVVAPTETPGDRAACVVAIVHLLAACLAAGGAAAAAASEQIRRGLLVGAARTFAMTWMDYFTTDAAADEKAAALVAVARCVAAHGDEIASRPGDTVAIYLCLSTAARAPAAVTAAQPAAEIASVVRELRARQHPDVATVLAPDVAAFVQSC